MKYLKKAYLSLRNGYLDAKELGNEKALEIREENTLLEVLRAFSIGFYGGLNEGIEIYKKRGLEKITCRN